MSPGRVKFPSALERHFSFSRIPRSGPSQKWDSADDRSAPCNTAPVALIPTYGGRMTPKGKQLDAAAAAALIRPRDVLLCGFVAGQPVALLEAIGEVLYCGILGRPYAFLKNPEVRVVSGFFGPVERMARAAGGRVSFLPADFPRSGAGSGALGDRRAQLEDAASRGDRRSRRQPYPHVRGRRLGRARRRSRRLARRSIRGGRSRHRGSVCERIDPADGASCV